MIVWKGWGFLGLLIPLILSVSVGEAIDSNYGDHTYQNSEWAMPLVLGLSAVLVSWIGYKLNSKQGRILIDPENNERVELKTIHSMFWIPLQYWGIIIVAISIWMYIANLGLIYNN